ncbi:MAG TPA: hypothetical protein VIW22_01070 [Nitrososphaerales archaeon]
MKTGLRIGLAVGAVVLVAVGFYYVSYGAVYDGTYFLQGGFGGCGIGCFSSSSTDATITLSNYPIWNPPAWNHVNYTAGLCNPTPNATYTPQNSPPSCLYPPADFSADYTRNYGGIILIGLGATAATVTIKAKETVPSEASSTAS